MFLDSEGKPVEDEKFQKLAKILAPVTKRFTKDCQDAAEEHEINLTVVVKFEPAHKSE